ncbi:hypothetical protein H0A66_08715 [Alcaligenaceae bacterium]|nr:hypothetical protein [Alcaligenaceae bacterium]
MKKLNNHPDSTIIDRLGGTGAVARICEVASPSVTGWKKRGIPHARAMYLRLLHPEAFDVAQQGQSVNATRPGQE